MYMIDWLCFTSHRQRGHLETAPQLTVPYLHIHMYILYSYTVSIQTDTNEYRACNYTSNVYTEQSK